MSIILALLGGWLGKALDFLKGLPWRVYAIGAGILGLLLLWHVHTGWEKSAYNDAYNAGYLAEKKNADAIYALNQQNVATCKAAIDQKNAETKQRAQAYSDSKTADQASIAKLDAAQKAAAGQIQALRALAKQIPANPACRVPDALTANLEGL